MTVHAIPREASDLKGRHVLALLPPANKERTQFLSDVLLAAKDRWGWRVSVICNPPDLRSFEALTAGGGQANLRPHLLRVMDWERDEAAVAEVERRLREAEVASGLPAGRIILAAGHNVGRAYNVPVRHTRSYALVRRVLKDNSEPYRIVRRLFRFADDMLEKAKPDLCYMFEWATPLNCAIWFAAQRRGIPCVALRYSKIRPDHGFWTRDRLMLNTDAIAAAEKARRGNAKVSEAANEYVRKFRERPAVIKYISTKWSNRMRRSFIRWHLQNARVIVREFINGFRGQDTALREFPLARFFRYYHSLYLMWRHERFLRTFDDETLAKTKFVYLPLHKEAELAQTFQATLWHDQRNTLRIIASMLPFGYRLLVREHRMNYGYRPTRSYKELSKIPNVTLIDPFDSQFKYLRHADLVVTENGSSGWEGLLLGKRVLLLAQTFYDGAGLGLRMGDPDKLNAAIIKALAEPPVTDDEAYDRALGCVFDAEVENTFALSNEGIAVALDQLGRALRSAQHPTVAA